MGVSSPAGPERPYAARRSIRFTFISMVAVPTACLMVLWAVAVAFGSGLDDHLSSISRRRLGELILLGGGALLVIVIAVILMGSFARRLSRDISDLAATARRIRSRLTGLGAPWWWSAAGPSRCDGHAR